ncbi:baculoviral IAP repeat-containing protein 3-like [Littorina saxatilis]|uniref:RING-type domain-containing protein n=1 Tax=Littorina saxatilis TaxID=31220 RepID=A0AAN9GNX7_9CAEN
MACASKIPANQFVGKGPGTKELPEDKDLLKQPFAAALQDMGFDRLDLILHAAKQLQLENRPLQAPTVMIEVEELLDLERRGKSLPPLQKPREHDYYGSDGESEGGSMEYYDANDGHLTTSSSKHDDLQTDCAEPEPPSRLKEAEMRSEFNQISKLKATELPSPVIRKEEIPREAKRKISGGKDAQFLRQKLQVLRSENKRLKERQLCRDCHSKPVSITFLPCGHYSYCYDCGQQFSACPICRKTILADVRTFLA